MFGKRKCTLCGGTLDSNNVCTFCGLDNTKNDSYYRLNRSDCDHDGLTHVHEDLSEKKKKASERKPKMSGRINSSRKPKTTFEADWEINRGQAQHKYENTPGYTGSGMESGSGRKYTSAKKTASNGQSDHDSVFGAEGRKKQGRSERQDFYGKKLTKKGKLFNVVLILGIACICYYSYQALEENPDSEYEDVGYDYDPYEDITDSLPETGESVSYTLSSGNYIVGVTIPAGNYAAEVQNSYDTVEISDAAHKLDIYTYDAQDYSELDDLRLYPGAVLIVNAEDTITFYSDNAQTSDMSGMKNPLKDSAKYTLDEDATCIYAGDELDPGVYDIYLKDGECYGVSVYVWDDNGDAVFDRYYTFTSEEDGNAKISNVVLPENSYIEIDNYEVESSGITIKCKPSKTIESENYLDFYKTLYIEESE